VGTYKRRKCVPRPEPNHKSEPREEEYSAIGVDWVEEWDRTGLAVDWVDLRGRPEVGEFHIGVIVQVRIVYAF
jgi:hypothetical protein